MKNPDYRPNDSTVLTPINKLLSNSFLDVFVYQIMFNAKNVIRHAVNCINFATEIELTLERKQLSYEKIRRNRRSEDAEH